MTYHVPLSDQMYLRFSLPFMTYDTQQYARFVRRNWSASDKAVFEEELSQSELAVTETDDVNWLFNEYKIILIYAN